MPLSRNDMLQLVALQRVNDKMFAILQIDEAEQKRIHEKTMTVFLGERTDEQIEANYVEKYDRQARYLDN